MFEQLPSNSKVWVYQSNREISDSESDYLESELKTFLEGWAAHGSQLYGDITIKHNRFVIFAVDEAKTGVSGCSIDTSVHKMKELGAELGLDFFNRMNLFIEKNGDFKLVHISDLKDYSDWHVFNPMVSTLDELRTNWKIPVSQSPFV